MDAALRGSDHHIVRIHLTEQPRPAEGKDHKHGPSRNPPSPRPAPRPDAPRDEQPAPSLARRAVRWLRGEPVVVGAVAMRDMKDGWPTWRKWSYHITPLATVVFTNWAHHLANDGKDGAAGYALATSAGLAGGYAAQPIAMRLLEGCAWLHERWHLHAAGLTPPQQLERIVELANAQPLSRQGLHHAIDRIEALQRLHPAQVDPAAAADAVARLASQALAPGPRALDHLDDLVDALEDWHPNGLIDGPTMARALLRMGRALCERQPAITQASKDAVLIRLIVRLDDWATAAPGRLSEADRVAFLRDMGNLAATGGANVAIVRQRAWGAFTRDLPADPGAQYGRIIDRLVLARPDPDWLVDSALAHARALHEPLRGGPFVQAYARCVLRLGGAMGADLDAAQVLSWILDNLWDEDLQGVPGMDEELPALLPDMVDAFGWELTQAHLTGMVRAMAVTRFFDTEPAADEAARHVLALVRPTVALSLRLFLISMVQRLWGVSLPLEAHPALAPDIVLALLRDVPVGSLARDLPSAMARLVAGRDPVQAARHCLAAMDTLAQRSGAPGFPRLDAGLVQPALVEILIRDIVKVPPGRGTGDRAALIARLPQLCQRSATPRLVQCAVDALRALPELRTDPPQQNEALQLALQACTSPTLFISQQDEAAQAQADAQAPAEVDFLTQAPAQPGTQPPPPRTGDAAAPGSAAIEFPWLTDEFIAGMAAPLTAPLTAPASRQRESKHG